MWMQLTKWLTGAQTYFFKSRWRSRLERSGRVQGTVCLEHPELSVSVSSRAVPITFCSSDWGEHPSTVLWQWQQWQWLSNSSQSQRCSLVRLGRQCREGGNLLPAPPHPLPPPPTSAQVTPYSLLSLYSAESAWKPQESNTKRLGAERRLDSVSSPFTI